MKTMIVMFQTTAGVFVSKCGLYTFDTTLPSHMASITTPKGEYMLTRDCFDADLRDRGSYTARYVGDVPGIKHQYGERWNVRVEVLKRVAELSWTERV